jgi:flagellar hook-associated protein 3 FlgL
MIERITALMTTQSTVSNLESDLSSLTNTENELSSGKKINQPSDDPYGTSVVLQLNSDLSAQSNYAGNITDGTNWLNTASGALSDINNMVERVRELAVEGANGSNSQTDDQDAAAEVNQLIDQIKQSANTTYAGNYIFSGTSTGTAPYQAGSTDTYQGNSGAITREIGPNENVQVNSNLESVLGNGGSDGLLLSNLRQIASDLSSGNESALSTTDLSNLDTSLSSVAQLQSGVGALTNRLTLASARVSSNQAADTTELASTQDVNMATAATDYSTEQASYQAALQAGASIIQESLVNFLK